MVGARLKYFRTVCHFAHEFSTYRSPELRLRVLFLEHILQLAAANSRPRFGVKIFRPAALQIALSHVSLSLFLGCTSTVSNRLLDENDRQMQYETDARDVSR